MAHAKKIADALAPSHRAVLPFVPTQPPGEPWFDILARAPHNRRGHVHSYRQTIARMIERGLVLRREMPRRDHGTQPFDRFHLSALGRAVLEAVNG